MTSTARSDERASLEGGTDDMTLGTHDSEAEHDDGAEPVQGEAPAGLGSEAALRYQKAQLRAMAEQLKEGQVNQSMIFWTCLLNQACEC